MTAEKERVLVAESDPDVSDLIARQALQPLGYRVKVTGTASEAIQQAALFSPDLVITSLDLPDLSGKDLLVALTSQGLDIPVILIAPEDRHGDVIQAFRLGATDYLSQPLRETELVSAVERALRQVRARREREVLARQLRQTNQELQRRVRELTTILAIGKAVTSITDQSSLFDRIVEGAVYVTEAQRGWLLIRDESREGFVLRAYRNLPKPLEMKLNQPWDDGISSLVALSGEPLSIHGEPLKRFKISSLGQAALVVPVRAQKETIGLLVVVRQAAQPFSSSDQTLLEAVADYASISLINARLFRALEERARSLQKTIDQARKSERAKDELIQKFSEELRRPLFAAKGYVEMLLDGQLGELSAEQSRALHTAESSLEKLAEIIGEMGGLNRVAHPGHLSQTSLNDLARKALSRFQPIAQKAGLALLAELPAENIAAFVNPAQISQVFDGLLTNAIKFTPRGGQITIRVERAGDNQAHVVVKDTGIGIAGEELSAIFERYSSRHQEPRNPIRQQGIRLATVKDIIAAHDGQVWAESTPGRGAAFHFTLLTASDEGD